MNRIMLLFLLILCGSCKDSRQRPVGSAGAQAQRTTPTPAPTKTLGNGYRGAKWGMKRDEVKQVVLADSPAAAVTDGDADTLEVEHRDGSVVYRFYKQRLYAVKFSPKAHGEDETRALVSALIGKFGQPDENYKAPYVEEVYQSVIAWNSKDTRIEARGYVLGAAAKPSAFDVLYFGNHIYAEKVRDDKLAADAEKASRFEAARKGAAEHL